MTAFANRYEGYPTRKLYKTTGFALSVLMGAGRILAETRAVYEAGKQDERNERLAALLKDPNRQSVIGPIQLRYRTREVVYRETADGSFKLDLVTPWPGDSEVTVIDEEGDDAFTVIVRPQGADI